MYGRVATRVPLFKSLVILDGGGRGRGRGWRNTSVPSAKKAGFNSSSVGLEADALPIGHQGGWQGKLDSKSRSIKLLNQMHACPSYPLWNTCRDIVFPLSVLTGVFKG